MSKAKTTEPIDDGGGEKLILKAEVYRRFLSNYDYSPERDSIMFLNLVMSGKRLEALNNTLLEYKGI
jgi:hypothetical protein